MLLPALFLIAGRYLQPPPAEQAAARKTEAYYLADPRAAARQNLAFVKGLELLHHVDDFVPQGACLPPPTSAADRFATATMLLCLMRPG